MDESITLNFKQGSSDKVYKAELVGLPEGYLVNFWYGRRGKPMRGGTKTAAPVSYDIAKRAYDSLIQEKRAKGYTEDTNGTPFEGSKDGVVRTDYLPQLLNPIEPDDVTEALSRAEGELWLQIKYDGERRMVIVTPEDVYGSNRKGLRVELPTNMVEAFQEILAALPVERLVLDGEDMGDHIFLFDILEWGYEDLTPESFATRMSYLQRMANLAPEIEEVVRVALARPCASLDEIGNHMLQAEAANQEGIVLRDPRASYTPGRPNSWGPCLKIKFYATATCIVDFVHPTKSSIGLAMLDTAGNSGKEKLRKVGNCTIPPNYRTPHKGALVEIKYLYAYRGGSLYQPQYKGVRTDLTPAAASTIQLKYKD
jgi:bifunctional non-homologous end joining protein LigD